MRYKFHHNKFNIEFHKIKTESKITRRILNNGIRFLIIKNKYDLKFSSNKSKIILRSSEIKKKDIKIELRVNRFIPIFYSNNKEINPNYWMKLIPLYVASTSS